jgi:mycothiol system anti-sigma-R factor
MSEHHAHERAADDGAEPSVGVSDCGAAIAQLYYFLDNELTEELRAEFEAHLNACSPCVEMVSFESELRRVIADRCQDHVPTELIDRIAAAILRESEGAT